MACRLHNLGKHQLAVDLRGGSVMYVQPNQISPPVREELLYDNIHLPVWEAQGLVRRIDAKMAEVLHHEAKAAGLQPPDAAKPKTAAKADKVGSDKTEDDDTDEADDEEEKVEKKPRRAGK